MAVCLLLYTCLQWLWLNTFNNQKACLHSFGMQHIVSLENNLRFFGLQVLKRLSLSTGFGGNSSEWVTALTKHNWFPMGYMVFSHPTETTRLTTHARIGKYILIINRTGCFLLQSKMFLSGVTDYQVHFGFIFAQHQGFPLYITFNVLFQFNVCQVSPSDGSLIFTFIFSICLY